MSLILLNSQSNQQIPLKRDDSFVIGRQNVFGCFDKKVSKNHGRITCTENGKINLLALHNNPCFFMRKGVPPIHRLSKGEEETLNEGDCLGLLPDSFWFQICQAKVKKEPEEGNEELWRPSETGKSELVRESEASTSKTQNAGGGDTGASSEYSKKIGSPKFERTRKLPLYMYETDEVTEAGKGSNATDNDTKTKKMRLHTDCKTPSGASDDCASNDNSYGNNLEKPSTSGTCVDATLATDTKPLECSRCKKDKYSDAGKQAGKTDKRPMCKFQQDCFRKNEQHKRDFSHPSDEDYVPYDKRPLCRHGVLCYRKNLTHRVEYRHIPHLWSQDVSSDSSSLIAPSPLPPKRRREKVKRNSEYEDDEEDDYDLEDPFINDESSDEYVPSCSNSEEDLNESQEID